MTDGLRDMVTTPERERSYLRSGLWDDSRLIDRIAEHAAAAPATPAIFDEHVTAGVSYGRLEHDSNRVASMLIERGIEPGDVVALQLPNWYASAAIAVGAMKAGAVVNPMLPSYRERELRHMLGIGQAKAIFTPGGYRGTDHASLVASLRGELPALAEYFVVTPDLDKLDGLPDDADPVRHGRAPGDVAELIFTSGTEAAPKAVMHTERTLNSNLRATWDVLAMSSSDAVWMPAPIGHSTGFNHGLRLALYHGLRLVFQDRWDPVTAVELVAKHQATHTLLSTTFLLDLVRVARAGAGAVPSLTLFGCGGAAIPPEAVMDANEVGIRCLRLYGASEFLVASWNRPDANDRQLRHTDGQPLPGVEIEVRDDSGSPVVGRQGEIYVRSAGGSVGFFRDDERTRATYLDGWIRSGDLGLLDADGSLSVLGRRKEIIIRGGLNISPRAIEDLILQIPAVDCVAVIGLPDARLGDITCACVVLVPGGELSFDQMIEHFRTSGMARFKWPERLEVLDEIPTTATGKIRRHELVARLKDVATA